MFSEKLHFIMNSWWDIALEFSVATLELDLDFCFQKYYLTYIEESHAVYETCFKASTTHYNSYSLTVLKIQTH